MVLGLNAGVLGRIMTTLDRTFPPGRRTPLAADIHHKPGVDVEDEIKKGTRDVVIKVYGVDLGLLGDQAAGTTANGKTAVWNKCRERGRSGWVRGDRCFYGNPVGVSAGQTVTVNATFNEA